MYPDDTTATPGGLKTVQEYYNNASRFEKIGLNRLEHVPYCREGIPISKICQELSRTTTIAVRCHHGYTRITQIVQVVAIRGKNRDSVTWALQCKQRKNYIRDLI
jgi:hypothetical protein